MGGRGNRSRLLLRLLGWAALIAALTATTGALVGRRLFFANDDLLEFAMARDHGLSWTTLSQNVFQHFAPYNRLVHLVIHRFGQLSPSLALVFVLAHYAVLLATCLWLLTELRVSTPRRVLALVWIGLLVSVSETAVWLDGATHILPALAVTLGVCALHVRGIRTGRGRWHVLALVLFVLGQATQERPVLALPLAVLLDWFVLWRGQPWRERLRRLWQLRWPLGGLAVAALAIAVALKIWVVIPGFPAPDWSTTLRAMLSAFSNYAVPSLVNLPLAHPAGVLVQLLVLAAVVLVGIGLSRLARGNGDLLLFAAATFLLYYGFLKFSPLLNPSTITDNAERLNYVIYVAVPAVLGLVQMHFPRPRARRRVDPVAVQGPRRRVRATVQAVACLLVAAFLVVTDIAYLDRVWSAGEAAQSWLRQVRASADVWTDPGVTVLPLSIPATMAYSWAKPLGREDSFLSLIQRGYTTADVGSDVRLIDDTGALRPARLQQVAPMTVVDGGCASAGGPYVDDADVDLARGVRGAPLFVLLRYRATDQVDVKLSAGWGRKWVMNALPNRVPAGSNTQVLPIEASRVGPVDLRVLTKGAGMCVQSAVLVRPVVVDPDGAGCHLVDRYGRPTDAVPCTAPAAGRD